MYCQVWLKSITIHITDITDARNPANYQHVHNALDVKVNAREVTSPKFHIGDKERIPRKKGTFEKGFTPRQKRCLPLAV